MSRLGENIKSVRESKGMTAKQLAKKCGLAESVILDVERGTRILSDIQVHAISRALGMDDMTAGNVFGMEVDAFNDMTPITPPPVYQRSADVPKVRQPAAKPKAQPAEAPADAWMDALQGVMKRVPVIDENGAAVEHRLVPVLGGRIEGGQPDKVFYYRCPDDSMRGFRLRAGDLLLTVPQTTPVDGAIMIVESKGRRLPRMIKRLEGNRVMLQSMDRELASVTVGNHDVNFLGRCVRMEAKL